MTSDNADALTDEQLQELWQGAPETELTPFLSGDDKNALAESGATVQLIGMTYVQNSQYGPRFGATLVTPDGEKRYMTMKSSGGTTPRDNTNKWLLKLLNDRKVSHVPCRLVKHGQAFMLDKPLAF